MKFAYSLFIAGALVAPVSCAPFKRDVDPALVPEFGLASGLNPTGTGDCDGIAGANGQPIKIPCACPPDRASFLQSLNANVAAGKVVNNPSVSISFPTDASQASQLARIQAALVTLQNQRGPGVGCPASSTTFLAQQKAIQAGTAAATSPATSTGSTNTGASSGGLNEALIPEFGLASGLNPTGTGDCDGITGANGQPIKIPCACPPDRASFIQSLKANVAAGKVVNNPSVSISFPEDNSQASQLARIQAALVTLQNQRGSGVGCPASSTTFLAQQKAIQAGTAAPASPAPAAGSTTATTATSSAGGVNEALVPAFGLAAGLNPTGTGDCDGIAGPNGQPIKIPCACPPDRASFIQSLNANVAAGHIVNNPGIAISFPEDDSTASKITRIQASLTTLQNLRGPGVGCPASSTTLLSQLKALQG